MSDDFVPAPPAPTESGGKVPDVNLFSARVAHTYVASEEFYFHPQGATIVISPHGYPMKFRASGDQVACDYSTDSLRSGRGRWVGPVRIGRDETF